MVRTLAVVFLVAMSWGAWLGAVDRLPTGVAGFVGIARRGPLDEPVLVDSFERFVEIFGAADATLPNPYLAPALEAYFSNGGERAHVVRVANATESAFLGSRASASGLEALARIDEISIVSLPGVTDVAIQNGAISHCERLGDRMAVLDAEDVEDLDAVRLHKGRLRSPSGYAALYYPWLRVDPAPGELDTVPPSGFAAGVYARTDREDGVWKAPVGQLVGVVDVSQSVGVAEQEILNPRGISVLRNFVDRGIQVWGARTIATDPEWKFVSIRRLFLFVEEAIDEGTQWVVFEPNDEPLWASLRTSVGTFLDALWRDGALLGASPEDAYFVRVDRSTMTEADLEAGRTIILIGVAPLRPAEFMTVQIVHERGVAARFRRGDSNGDGDVDLSDPVRVLEFLFLGGEPLPCEDAADATDAGEVTITSAVYVLDFLFKGGPPLAAPAPLCGEDATADTLECVAASKGCE